MPTLTWLTRKESMTQTARAPYRALVGLPALDYGRLPTDNLLIQGDNLHALKALCPYFAGQVKCIFIDPPYNTRQDFDHYQDNLQHTQWLEMMYPRLTLLNELLAEDGSIWVIIDDEEAHYLKVLMDEIFGRKNFVANVVWQKKHTRANDAKWFSDNHDHIMVYAKNKEKWAINKLPRTAEQDRKFKNPDNDPRGVWASQPIQVKTPSDNYIYEIQNPAGMKFWPPKGRSWQFSYKRYLELVEDNRIWFGEKGTNVPRIKKFLFDVQDGLKPVTIWLHQEVGHNQEAKQEVKKFNDEDVFATPKPERLIQRVLHLATEQGDLVLDSFLGSGTTAAVAHKMGRRWIGVEMGEQAETHCALRLRSVIDGEQGGISEAANWQGGGGFHFLRLGGAVFTDDGDISPAIKFPELAAYIWFAETRVPLPQKKRQNPFLGVHSGIGYALLYNGILGDKTINGGNVLIMSTLAHIRQGAKKHKGKIIVYGESCRLGENRLKLENIEFRQLPYECKKR